jgi:hypothetical protein
MPRSWDWVAVQFAIVLVFISLVGASWIIATGSSGDLAAGEPASLGEGEDGDRIRLATRAADVFVLLTAAPTGSVEITTIPGDERDLPVEAVRASVGSDTLNNLRGEFIFDVHTHHVMPDGPWRRNAPRIADMIRGLVPAGCVDPDPLAFPGLRDGVDRRRRCRCRSTRRSLARHRCASSCCSRL